MRTPWLAALLLGAVSVSTGQNHSVSLERPFGDAHALVSPDGHYALAGKYPASELWIEDTRTHQQRFVAHITVQTMSLAWSQDSSAFLVNDRAASDLETASLYDVASLNRLDLGRAIAAADPQTGRFFLQIKNGPAPFSGFNGRLTDHSYVHGTRWLDANHVAVRISGHTDGVCAKVSQRGDGCQSVRPSLCFEQRFAVSRAGKVRKLGGFVTTAGAKRCVA
jgi:hypothetical protein